MARWPGAGPGRSENPTASSGTAIARNQRNLRRHRTKSAKPGRSRNLHAGLSTRPCNGKAKPKRDGQPRVLILWLARSHQNAGRGLEGGSSTPNALILAAATSASFLLLAALRMASAFASSDAPSTIWSINRLP